MSKEGTKETVLRTTKVRTKLKGDASWLQRRNDVEAETDKEKPWLAEVRSSRLNGANVQTSSESTSPTTSTAAPAKSDTERSPTSGYLIRGVFTKLDKPASSSTANGVSRTSTQFTKKPSESYKKIAPYTVRPSSENPESPLSTEEQEKRTEAASNVLKTSSVRQRSYVLSAARQFESLQVEKESSVVSPTAVIPTPAFVARRVEITDDDESAATPAPASSPPPSLAAPVTSVASAPEPKPHSIVNTSVKTAVDDTAEEPAAPKEEEEAAVVPQVKEEEAAPQVEEEEEEEVAAVAPQVVEEEEEVAVASPQVVEEEEEEAVASPQVVEEEEEVAVASPQVVEEEEEEAVASPQVEQEEEEAAPQVEEAAPEPVEDEPSPVSVPDPFEGMIPGCTKVDTPLPVLLPEFVQTVCTSPEPQEVSGQDDDLLADFTSVSQPVMSPTSPPPLPLSPTAVFPETEITMMTLVEPVMAPAPTPRPKPRSDVDTLTALSDTLISFDTTSTSVNDDEPVLAEEEGSSADSRTMEDGVEREPSPELSDCIPMTDDLLALADGPEESAEPVPPSPGRWSQDLLSGLDSESNPVKTSGALDLLADDVIPINTDAHSLGTLLEEKQTDETAKKTQSLTETVTVTTKTVIITESQEDSADPWSSHVTTTKVTESSSADPFDPYPIGTTSSNSASDLLQPLSDISITRVSTTYMENKDPSPEPDMSSNVLESLADDVIPISTDTTSLSSHRSWARTWDTTPADQAEESQEAAPEGQTEEQTLVMFERKSTEDDSPWDRWTSPTVYTVTTTTGEEEEEEEEKERSEYTTQTETVTTITTVRETHSDTQTAMDRYETYSRSVTEEERSPTPPEPEAKKGFVYVKEYVNTSETSLHNAVDNPNADYLTSSSSSYSYSSPSTYSSGQLSSTCNFCGEQVGNDARITIDHLNINCHPACFQCGVCSKPMGDLLYSMFLHAGKVHCEACYSRALD